MECLSKSFIQVVLGVAFRYLSTNISAGIFLHYSSHLGLSLSMGTFEIGTLIRLIDGVWLLSIDLDV